MNNIKVMLEIDSHDYIAEYIAAFIDVSNIQVDFTRGDFAVGITNYSFSIPVLNLYVQNASCRVHNTFNSTCLKPGPQQTEEVQRSESWDESDLRTLIVKHMSSNLANLDIESVEVLDVLYNIVNPYSKEIIYNWIPKLFELQSKENPKDLVAWLERFKSPIRDKMLYVYSDEEYTVMGQTPFRSYMNYEDIWNANLLLIWERSNDGIVHKHWEEPKLDNYTLSKIGHRTRLLELTS